MPPDSPDQQLREKRWKVVINTVTGEIAPNRQPGGHDAYCESLEGGHRGYQARCWDCDFRGPEHLRGGEPMGTDGSRAHKNAAKREAAVHAEDTAAWFVEVEVAVVADHQPDLTEKQQSARDNIAQMREHTENVKRLNARIHGADHQPTPQKSMRWSDPDAPSEVLALLRELTPWARRAFDGLGIEDEAEQTEIWDELAGPPSEAPIISRAEEFLAAVEDRDR